MRPPPPTLAPAADDGKVIAPVEELELVAPGNALVWELIQDKGLDRAELRDRIATTIKKTWP